MKTKLNSLFTLLALLVSVHQAIAQDSRFFRISGPVATTITEIGSSGTMVWTNAPTNAFFTIQIASSLAGGAKWADYVQVPTTNGVTTNRVIDLSPPSGMALIPAGSFTMGNCMDTNEGGADQLPLHTVFVSAVYMDKYDVTKALWGSVYQWATNHGYNFDNVGSGKATTHPVQTVNWYDCLKWCNARSEKEGRTPAYYTSTAMTTVYRRGDVDITNGCVSWNRGYRLPTEAEWEKAARGGIGGQRFPWGNTISWSQANFYSYWVSGSHYYPYDLAPTNGYDQTFNDGVAPYTNPVGYFAPNGYGLYDMAGNVWQWCWDWFGSYPSASQSDPHGPTVGQYGAFRVLRGGAWNQDAVASRIAFRNHDFPAGSVNYNGHGFRSVLPTIQP